MAPKTKTRANTDVKLVVSAPYMDKYWELDQQIKALEAQREELKPQVLQFLREQSHPLYTFSTSKTSVKIDPFKIYDWLSKSGKVPPEKLESLATHSLAPEALDLLFLEKYYVEEDIPPDCYKTTGGTETIRPKAKKD